MTKLTVMKTSDLRKMKVEELFEFAQANGIFIWHDSTRQDVFDALKAKLIDGDKTIWCA